MQACAVELTLLPRLACLLMDPRFAVPGFWRLPNATTLKYAEESLALELLLMPSADPLGQFSAMLVEVEMDRILSALPVNFAALMVPTLFAVLKEPLAELHTEPAMLQLLPQHPLLTTALPLLTNQV